MSNIITGFDLASGKDESALCISEVEPNGTVNVLDFISGRAAEYLNSRLSRCAELEKENAYLKEKVAIINRLNDHHLKWQPGYSMPEAIKIHCEQALEKGEQEDE